MHLSHMFPTLLYYIITLSFKTKLKLNINNPLFTKKKKSPTPWNKKHVKRQQPLNTYKKTKLRNIINNEISSLLFHPFIKIQLVQ